MGQKTHPIGFRLAQRGLGVSWFGVNPKITEFKF